VRRPCAVRLGDFVSPCERVSNGDHPRNARAAVYALVGRAESEDVRSPEAIVTLVPGFVLARRPEPGRDAIRDSQEELGRDEEQEGDRAEQRAADHRLAQQRFASQ